jgi:hypothetical protein
MRKINEARGPPIPMKKLNMITKNWQVLGSLKKNVLMYVNPAADGPNNIKEKMVALRMLSVVVVYTS